MHSEADGLPGLIVDRYGEYLAVQFLTAGVDRVKADLIGSLRAQLAPAGIVDRSDPAARRQEGLATDESGLDPAPVSELIILENGHRFAVDLKGGQKTGFYLDQRANRRRVAPLAMGRIVLDAFCYSGGFTIPLLSAGAAHVTAIDSSAPALELLRRNLALNGLPEGQVEIVDGNVFEELRRYRSAERKFDLIILDPPKLAASHAQIPKAMRAYKDLNLLAMKLASPGGLLATFSCSGAISVAAFQEAVAWAAADAGRPVQILERLSQGEDHPTLVSFSESEYLKGLLCRVV